MDSYKINVILSKYPTTRNHFIGVFSPDTLPIKQLKKISKAELPVYLICNLSDSTFEGSHWIAILYNVKTKVHEYFDSYGWKAFVPQICQLLNDGYIYNKQKLQNSTTTTCGQWCIFYIYNRIRGYTMKQIINMFDKKHTLINDFAVNDAVENIFSTELEVCDKVFFKKKVSEYVQKSKSCAEVGKIIKTIYDDL